MNRQYLKTTVGVAVFLASCFFARPAQAYTFVPSDVEFSGWPGYCQGAYVFNTKIGEASKWATRVGQRQKNAFTERANSGVRGLHHACAGMIWLNRSRGEKDQKSRQYMLARARRETQFSFARSNTQSYYFADVATQKAMIEYELGEYIEAIDILTQLIRHQSSNPVPYSALAVILRRLGRLEEAKLALLKGDDAVDGQSAEIKYNLGLVTLELGELDQAKAYAESAYDLGYPLPGLRTKLAAAMREDVQRLEGN